MEAWEEGGEGWRGREDRGGDWEKGARGGEDGSNSGPLDHEPCAQPLRYECLEMHAPGIFPHLQSAAPYGDRAHDHTLTKRMLCQLS